MGLAASQARMLFITARKSDVEFSQMRIASNKISLARETEDLSDDYNRSLNMRKLTFALDGGATSANSVDLSYDLLMSPNSTNVASQYMITDMNNRVVLSDGYVAKLGLSGDGGNLGAMDRNAFLAKFGIDGTKCPEVTNGGGVAGPGSAKDPVADLPAIVASMSKLFDSSCMGESNFREAGSSTLTEPVYNSMKPVLESLAKNINSALDSAKTTAADKAVYQTMKNDINVAIKALDLARKGDATVATGAIATLKTIFSGASFSNTLPDVYIHHDSRSDLGELRGGIPYRSYKTNDIGWAYLAADKNLWTKASGLGALSYDAYYKNNMKDLVAVLQANNTSSPGTKPQTPNTPVAPQAQASADFYTNLFHAIKANGWSKNSNITNPSYLSNQLINNNLRLQRINSDGSWSQAALSDPSSPIRNVRDTEGAADAKTKYDLERDKINDKDSLLDLQMKNLETERSALDTEVDSVKGIIQKNIERSFKTFA